MINLARLAWLVRCLEWAQHMGHNKVFLLGRRERGIVVVEFGLAGPATPPPPQHDVPDGYAVAVISVDELRTWLSPFRRCRHG